MSTSTQAQTDHRPHHAALLQLAIVIVAPSLGALSALWIWPGPVGGALYALCKLVLYGVPLWILWRQLGVFRLLAWPFSQARSSVLLAGLISGGVIGAGIWLLWKFVLAGRADVTPLIDVMIQNGMDNPLKFWVFAAWLCLVNSLLEEIVFRWYVDTRLESIGFSIVLVLPVSAFIFTAHHIIVLSAYFSWPLVVLGSAGVFCGGVIWSVLRMRYATLLPGWISHALVDVSVVVIGWSILESTIPTAP